jgi:hypothetical protein
MAEGRAVYSPVYWAQTNREVLPSTVTLGWLYNRSKWNILLMGIAHAAANTDYAFFPNLDWTIFNWTVVAAALIQILVDRMWKKLPSDRPAVYKSFTR